MSEQQKVKYPPEHERFFPVADLDAAKLREQAALEQARRARESAAAMTERLQAAEARAAELQADILRLGSDSNNRVNNLGAEAHRRITELEARAAAFEKRCGEFKADLTEARNNYADVIVKAVELSGTAEFLKQQLELSETDAGGERRDQALGDALVEVAKWQAHAARLAAALRELSGACEDADAQEELPGSVDGSLLDSARAALSAAPAESLARLKALEEEHAELTEIENGKHTVLTGKLKQAWAAVESARAGKAER